MRGFVRILGLFGMLALFGVVQSAESTPACDFRYDRCYMRCGGEVDCSCGCARVWAACEGLPIPDC